MKKFSKLFEGIGCFGMLVFWGVVLFYFGPGFSDYSEVFVNLLEALPRLGRFAVRVAVFVAIALFAFWVLSFLPPRVQKGLRDFALAVILSPIIFSALWGAFDGLNYLMLVMAERGNFFVAEMRWKNTEFHPIVATFFGGFFGSILFILRIFWVGWPTDDRPRGSPPND